jgi:DNA-binding IclR family transcriptional regulator
MLSDDLTEVVYIDAVVPSTRMTVRNNIGIRAPLYCTAIGKALLAALSDAEVTRVIALPAQRFTPNTIVDRKMLQEELEKTRRRGFAIDDMEHEYGIKCVGVAVCNPNGRPLCGVSISGPSLRFSQESIERYAKTLFELKARLEGRSGEGLAESG